jgi:ketosteroid isomerase-like protein
MRPIGFPDRPPRGGLFVSARLRQNGLQLWGRAMSDRAEKEKLLRGLYAARERDDRATIGNYVAGLKHFQMMGAREISPVAMTAKGADEIKPFVDQLVDTFTMRDITIVNLLIDGDRALVHWRARVTANPTGNMALTEIADLIEFENGQIVSMKEFCDTALAAKLMT